MEQFIKEKVFDYCDQQARNAYFHEDSEAIDFMFYLWSSIDSPLSRKTTQNI